MTAYTSLIVNKTNPRFDIKIVGHEGYKRTFQDTTHKVTLFVMGIDYNLEIYDDRIGKIVTLVCPDGISKVEGVMQSVNHNVAKLTIDVSNQTTLDRLTDIVAHHLKQVIRIELDGITTKVETEEDPESRTILCRSLDGGPLKGLSDQNRDNKDVFILGPFNEILVYSDQIEFIIDPETKIVNACKVYSEWPFLT